MSPSHEPKSRSDPAAGLPCDEFADELASYVWNALEPEERARVDHHRSQCAACDRWLRDSEQVVSQLDEAMPKLSPPPKLRGRVLASIDSLPQPAHSGSDVEHPTAAGAIRPARSTPDPLTMPVQSVAVASVGEHAGHARRPLRWRGSPFFAGVTTGLVGALAAAIFLVMLVIRPQDLNALVPRQSAFGASESGRPALPSFLPSGGGAASSIRVLELRASSGSGRGLLMYAADTRRGVLLVEGLAAPDGTEYAVSLTQGSQRVQLGSLTIDTRGVGTFVLPDPLPLDRPERIDVRLASQGGTDTSPALTATF